MYSSKPQGSTNFLPFPVLLCQPSIHSGSNTLFLGTKELHGAGNQVLYLLYSSYPPLQCFYSHPIPGSSPIASLFPEGLCQTLNITHLFSLLWTLSVPFFTTSQFLPASPWNLETLSIWDFQQSYLAGTWVGKSYYPSCPSLETLYSYFQHNNNLFTFHFSFAHWKHLFLDHMHGLTIFFILSLQVICPLNIIYLQDFLIPQHLWFPVDSTSRCKQDPLSSFLKPLSLFSYPTSIPSLPRHFTDPILTYNAERTTET